ncbi:BQ5605_C019g08930 [Microbotryum silenes-dioicae]|uniref:triacylglycerol lipase n=1 Tax=Microbotryum silenes-dioicae TaxID=796604 RepID=A0A2X0LW76_9BASI|nr:BQ5605_C019g08930 [Microbotryum silenes-dioicae]
MLSRQKWSFARYLVFLALLIALPPVRAKSLTSLLGGLWPTNAGSTSDFPYPNADSFYTPPSTFADDTPGTFYQYRYAINPGHSDLTATQVLFRTVDAEGKPATTVTTILQANPPTGEKQYLVAWNMYEDAAAPQCAPSYCFNTDLGKSFCPDLLSYIQKGWIVIVTDYEGTNSGFSVGHLAGYHILDGYRAAINFLSLPPKIILGGFGYSGGALATGWAASLHNTYAPELNIKAITLGGTPTNVTSTLMHLNGGLYAGFGMTGLAGQLAVFPDLNSRFNQIATRFGHSKISAAQSHCANYALLKFAFSDIFSTRFQSLGEDLLYDPVVSKYLKKSIMGTKSSETPTKPSICMYHSNMDEVIPYEAAQKTAHAWCRRGAKINFVTLKGISGHMGTQMAYGDTALAWLDGELRGDIAPLTKCSFTSGFSLSLPIRKRSRMHTLRSHSRKI